jgi:hypothetical protein
MYVHRIVENVIVLELMHTTQGPDKTSILLMLWAATRK